MSHQVLRFGTSVAGRRWFLQNVAQVVGEQSQVELLSVHR